jgi:hypothetical protein
MFPPGWLGQGLVPCCTRYTSNQWSPMQVRFHSQPQFQHHSSLHWGCGHFICMHPPVGTKDTPWVCSKHLEILIPLPTCYSRNYCRSEQSQATRCTDANQENIRWREQVTGSQMWTFTKKDMKQRHLSSRTNPICKSEYVFFS